MAWFKKDKKQTRNDGMANVMTGLGMPFSRSVSSGFIREVELDRETLTAMYSDWGLAKRIVDLKVEDAMRSFIECDQYLLEEMTSLRLKQHIMDAACWGRLYGGSILLAIVDDGRDLDQPLNYENINKIIGFRTYDRYSLSFTSTDVSTDIYSPYFLEPEIFTVNDNYITPFKVHRSRFHMFGGERTPHIIKARNNHWDQSVLQSVYSALRDYGTSVNCIAEIMNDFVQKVITIEGLDHKLLDPEEQKGIFERLSILKRSLSIFNAALKGENEEYEKHSTNVSGIADLLDKQVEHICAAKGIPVTTLMGRSPSGLSASGQHETRNWYDSVDLYRNDDIAPSIDWAISLIEKQKNWNSKYRPESFDWSFPSLISPDEEQLAKIRLMTAQTDQIYMDRGAVDPKFVYNKHYSSGKFVSDILFSDDELQQMKEEGNSLSGDEDLMADNNNGNIAKDSADTPLKRAKDEALINLLHTIGNIKQ